MSHIRNTKRIHEIHEAWAKENGYREKASSLKPEDLHAANANRFVNQALKASSSKLQANLNQNLVQVLKLQATSVKRQATSLKLRPQATSHKLIDP